ncbi:hypothetical protein FHS15_000597 [Paenibacillus castaneae]|nr:hypothetical protein [Paenibacillus castaneae]
MGKYRKMAIIIPIVLFIVIILHQFTFVQHVTARFTTSTYIAFKHKTMGFKYQSIEFSPQFGSYFVAYKAENQKIYNFEVKPKMIPFIVMYNPVNP